MKNYVITIFHNPKSVEAAERCISSAAYHGLQVEKFEAITPRLNIEALCRQYKINPVRFVEQYSRTPNCIAAFLSHYTLWRKCIEDNEEYTIFEHDAHVTTPIPDDLRYDAVVNLGMPSYGRFNHPTFGVGPLVSKRYFPGAHAYRLNPRGAAALVKTAETQAEPTDVYLSFKRFPFLQEYYPWPVEARDQFTTIQTKVGCIAKHNYNSTYEIL